MLEDIVRGSGKTVKLNPARFQLIDETGKGSTEGPLAVNIEIPIRKVANEGCKSANGESGPLLW